MQRLDDSQDLSVVLLIVYSRMIDLMTRRTPIAGVTAHASSVRVRPMGQMDGRYTYPQAFTVLRIAKSIMGSDI